MVAAADLGQRAAPARRNRPFLDRASRCPGHAVARSAQIDVFFRGRNNHLYQMRYQGSKWGNPIDLGGGLHSDVAVSSWGPDRIDLFRKGDDNTLEHRSWDGTRWTDWVIVGTGIIDTPAAVSWGPSRIDVLALGTNGQLLHKHFAAERTS